ncbi:hypothetical protein [Alkalimarinus sediminis]|uniref:Uncharacterized protein n=1 Tax=Alkalimarinus sediminis TaxID=1632866 RepID=A0A9E8HL07_9ALTE|nr:hypothetical protein [Alkalimarinus sediminis]UZW75282.1 hypothetical protein NNL22_01360 [Alkalimarinus sediminis]
MLDTHNKKIVDAHYLYQQHRRRLDGINNSKKLLDLMLEIQRHRAASLASLGGDLFFENRIVSIQKTTTRHLATLSRNDEKLLTEQEIRQLNGEWVTIRSQWQKDSVMQNFLLHSHLIDLILKINSDISQRAGHHYLNDQHKALTLYCLNDLPRLIESTAQARGLATHCAAQKTNSDKIISKIKFLIDEVKAFNSKAQSTIVQCSAEHYRIIQQSRSANNSQRHMETFLRQLSLHFTQHSTPELFSDEIYTSGSQFIMATYDVLLKAYKLMSKSIDGDMQEWIYRSSYHS